MSKKLTESQKRRKAELYEKYKAKVKNKPRKFQKTIWTEYQEKKYAIIHKSDIVGTQIISSHKLKSGSVKIYKTGLKKDLDSQVEQILIGKKQVRYFLVMLEFEQDEVKQYLSDSFTPQAYSLFKKYDIDLLESIMNKKGRSVKYEGFKLKNVLIKVIYESSTTYNQQEKNRRNKK